MHSFRLGDVEITQVVEFEGEFAPARVLVPDSSPQLWRDNESWLAPDHWIPETDGYRGAAQTWLLRSEGKIVLVDTAIGNDKNLPHMPLFDHVTTDFLDRLAAAGAKPEDVDVVVNTHIHFDHVGWNTRLDNGEWAPTFPNATYLIPCLDNIRFGPENTHGEQGNQAVYADSVAPVLDRAVLWEGAHRIDANLVLAPAPGHTPGSSLLRLESGADRAVFVGDLLHSPVQILRPECNSCFCEDPRQAAATRRGVLERAADNTELVVPAHFAGRGAVEVRRDGSNFEITRWA
jgi:glyoxylase-like metal-dependent hydrolase (beta-lactamase superfamily II)